MKIVLKRPIIGIKNILDMNKKELKIKTSEIRRQVLEMIYKSKSSHIGSCFSIIDILTVLYFQVMNIKPSKPNFEDRDIFVLSKGHAAAALYSTLALRGFFPISNLEGFCENGSKIAGHVIKDCLSGVEATAGSLGHGLSMTAGMALANRYNNRKFYCILGDGECNEGSVWEAAMFCSQFKLKNIILIVDVNKQQGLGKTDNIINMNEMAKKWESFGWDVKEVDGHDLNALDTQLTSFSQKKGEKPSVLIANTVKGKGVSFMEDKIKWHYKSPNEEEYKMAISELEKI